MKFNKLIISTLSDFPYYRKYKINNGFGKNGIISIFSDPLLLKKLINNTVLSDEEMI